MAEPARAGVDQHAVTWPVRQPEPSAAVPASKIFVDDLHLEEVVAGAERAALIVRPALSGVVGHLVGVGAGEAAAALRCARRPPVHRCLLGQQIAAPAEQAVERPGEPQCTTAAGADRHARIELVHDQGSSARAQSSAVSRQHEPHAAVDVVADAAGRDDAALVRDRSRRRRRCRSRSPSGCRASPGWRAGCRAAWRRWRAFLLQSLTRDRPARTGSGARRFARARAWRPRRGSRTCTGRCARRAWRPLDVEDDEAFPAAVARLERELVEGRRLPPPNITWRPGSKWLAGDAGAQGRSPRSRTSNWRAPAGAPRDVEQLVEPRRQQQVRRLPASARPRSVSRSSISRGSQTRGNARAACSNTSAGVVPQARCAMSAV